MLGVNKVELLGNVGTKVDVMTQNQEKLFVALKL
jgi:hypothetical protein